MSDQPEQPQQTSSEPVSKPVTNPNIKKINEKYASRITQGKISVTAEDSKDKLSPSQAYNRNIKQKKLTLAERERKSLQKKLAYLNKSIESIKNYDFPSGQSGPFSASPNHSASRTTATDPMEILKKNKEFHEKVREEKRKIEEKKKAERQRHEEKQRQLQEQKAQKEKQQKARRKQEILTNMKRIKNRMENRQAQIQKRQQDYHKVIAGTTLFKKKEKQQALNQSNVLQERKKKLAHIRNLHKPVSMIQIEQHEKKFFQALQEKQEMRQRQRRMLNAVEEYRVSYKSPRHKVYSQELYHQEDQNQSKIKADKVRQFAEHVRENFAPQVSDKLRDQVEKELEAEEEKRRRSREFAQQASQRAEEIRNKGLRYLQQVRDLPKRKSGSKTKPNPATDRPHYTNYLTHSEHSGKPKWGNILDSQVSRKDKAIRMKFQAQKIENSLKMRQQKARLLKNDPDNVDDDYYEMIKAKLELLQC